MTSVLLAEDDASISDPLARALRREGYDVNVSADGPSTLDAALAGGIDLIVLDLGLPRLDGLEVCRRLRSEGQSVPVLILTARADEVDTVIGLDAGADDYVTKPFRLAEFLARVRALLRRGSTETSMAQGVRVDTEARRAWLGDTELDLTTKEFDLLSVLVNEAGKVVTREQIMREVWDHEDPRHAHLLAAPQARRRRPEPALHHHRARCRVPLRAGRLGPMPEPGVSPSRSRA
jgi:DNA-binding response OmpR family regulator